jgi:hypothetical protein
MIETWRDIPDYEGFYEVSNMGNVRSVDREVWNGYTFFLKKGRPLKLKYNNYVEIHLCKEGKVKKHYVHRLVLASHYGYNPLLPHCNHLDGDHYNNHIDNLEWTTLLENNRHAHRIGLVPIRDIRGKNNPNYRHGLRVSNTNKI